jgi:hypothetical protein
MKTGNHLELEDYINMNSMPHQDFHMTGEYYTLHDYNLDAYDRRFAMIDTRVENQRLKDNPEFMAEIDRRIQLLKSQNFVFIKTTPWESPSTLESEDTWPMVDVPHVRWTGDTSWFWWLMYKKYKDHDLEFKHTEKKFDFLYLNKTPKKHRKKLYDQLHTDINTGSLVSYWPTLKLAPEYEIVHPYPERGLDQTIMPRQYEDTKYSLLSESTDVNTEVFMTERIWKSIIAEHVFVVHGNYLYLQKLREMGFKTFSKYFDEGYDLARDQNERAEKIANTCRDLLTKNWQDIYLQTKYLRQHNKNNFFDEGRLSAEINKQLSIFLEFADRS